MTQAKDETAANKELVVRFMKAAQAGDVETMTACMVEDYVQIFPRPGVPGMPAGAEGRDQIVKFLAELSVYERGSMQMEIENLIAEGPYVVIQFKMRARTARGEPYENYYIQFVECRDGKIARCWEYCDTLYAAGKLMPEALKAPAA